MLYSKARSRTNMDEARQGSNEKGMPPSLEGQEDTMGVKEMEDKRGKNQRLFDMLTDESKKWGRERK